ncbi:MAG: xanthine dehydrogenase family protein molybdopterin-binding subunit [Pikeienuella sp.]
MKFGIGQAATRKEDHRFLTGKGRYIDDIRPDCLMHAFVSRSPVAHAKVVSVDVNAARNAGAKLIYTANDISGRLADISCRMPLGDIGGPAIPLAAQPHLATNRVRYVGQPIAFVVADTLEAARDAAELIEFEYEDLPPLVTPEQALSPNAPALHNDAPGNLSYDWATGDEAATDAAFARAAHVVSTPVKNQRLIVTAMEPRGIVIQYADDRWEAWVGSQGAHAMRDGITKLLGVEPARMRVHAPDIGGGFGMKLMMHPEYGLAALAAKDLGCPVKWIADRSESFLSDIQARDLMSEVEGAFDADGRLLAIRMTSVSNLGAYHSSAGPAIHTLFSANMVGSLYRMPHYHHRVKGVLTTTTPTDAYRGAGRPEVIYCTERLMDAAARQIGMDPIALRRLNLLTPEDMPHTTPGGLAFDSADPAQLIDAALEASDEAGYAKRHAESAARGKIRGRAAIYYMERTGGAPQENAAVDIAPTGRAAIRIGTQSTGQGHETTWAQVLTDKLGLDWDAITLEAGDSDALPSGGGTGGSRSLIMASQVIALAADDIIEKLKPKAADELEVAVEDIEFDATLSCFSIAGTDRRVSLVNIVEQMGGVGGFGEITARTSTLPSRICTTV